jgi:hypothetical protein
MSTAAKKCAESGDAAVTEESVADTKGRRQTSLTAARSQWSLPCRRYVTTQVLASIVAVHQFVFPGRAHHWPNKRLYGRLLKRLKDRGRIGFVTQPTAGCPGDRDSLAST